MLKPSGLLVLGVWMLLMGFQLQAADSTNAAQSEIAPKVAAARAILDPWLAENPVRAQKNVHLVLWTPKDREPAPRYRERLSAIFVDIQKFYAREMERIGFGPRTIGLDTMDDGLLRVHLVRGLNDYTNYSTPSGSAIRKECLPTLEAAGLNPAEELIVIFCNMSNWDPEKRTISQNSPYYASGTLKGGTAWQVDSPILDLAFLEEKGKNVRDGQYGNISLGRYESIFIGGACHELGHSLGLPHNKERADERAAFGTALMGSGNRTYGEQLRGESKGSFLTLAHAFRLAAHPMFSGSVKDISKPRSAKSDELKIQPKGQGFEFSGRVTTASNEPPVYAVIAYMDPAGGNDYDSTTTTAVPDKDGKFTLDCQALAPGKTGELRVVYLQANGQASGFLSSTPYRYPYVVAKDGAVDISPALAVLNRAQRRPVAQTNAMNTETNVPTSLKALAGTEWTLKEIGGLPVPANSRVSLSIARDGTLSGNAGVNRFNGRARGGDGPLQLGPFMSTKMAGPPELMTLESKFLKSLSAATKFERDGDTLRINGAGEERPMVFTRQPTP
jgi:heat shock protein HslJ